MWLEGVGEERKAKGRERGRRRREEGRGGSEEEGVGREDERGKDIKRGDMVAVAIVRREREIGRRE